MLVNVTPNRLAAVAITGITLTAAFGHGAHYQARWRAQEQRYQQQRVSGSQVTAVGDSVMLASSPALHRALPGIWVNAVVGRQFAAGVQVVRWLASHRELRPVVVVGLGTNGTVTRGQMRALLAATGHRRVVLVSTFEARPWQREVNGILAAAARRYGRVTLAGWHDAIAGHTSLLVDGIHPGPAGARVYARVVAATVRRLRVTRVLPVRYSAYPRGYVGGNVRLGQRMAARWYGWSGGQWGCLYALWDHESGWSNTARNPQSGAYGIAQALGHGPTGQYPAGAANPPYSSARAQLRWGLAYIHGRYGSPCAAWGDWQARSPHWY